MKQCTGCKGNLADFVTVCPYCGVPQAMPQVGIAQPAWQLPPHHSNKAIASLVCGVMFFVFPASVAAVILGHLALSEIRKSAGRLTGQGMAVAGLATGYVGIAIGTLFMISVGIGVRSALRQTVPVNETATIATMRTYNQALTAYKAKCPAQGYPATLSRLGPGSGDCSHANLLDARLAIAQPVSVGYQFVYSPGVLGAERVTVFALVARPIQPGLTGKRYFYLDEGGVIRQTTSQIIGPNSPPIDDPNDDDDQDEDQNANDKAGGSQN